MATKKPEQNQEKKAPTRAQITTIKISDIKINTGRSPLDPGNVEEIAKSIQIIGLMNPITVTEDNTLIAGLHRLEAMKALEKEEIPCVKLDLDELKTELAEIDENITRKKLHFLDRGNQLLRRKHIYEELYPDAKAGIFKGNQYINMPCETISFTSDAADKLNVTRRTIEQEIQIAESLTAEAEDLIREKGMGKKDAILLAQKTQVEQLDIIEKIHGEEAKTIRGAMKKLTGKTQGKVVNVRIKSELYNKIAELAVSDGATATGMIETILKDFFKYIEDPDPPPKKRVGKGKSEKIKIMKEPEK